MYIYIYIYIYIGLLVGTFVMKCLKKNLLRKSRKYANISVQNMSCFIEKTATAIAVCIRSTKNLIMKEPCLNLRSQIVLNKREERDIKGEVIESRVKRSENK
jgi:hypothetical protein